MEAPDGQGQGRVRGRRLLVRVRTPGGTAEHRGDEARLRFGSGRMRVDDLAVPQDRHRVGQLEDFIQEVRHEDHGMPSAGERADDLVEPFDFLRRESR